MSRLIGSKEASEITGYCQEHIRRLAKWKKLKSVRVGGCSAYKFQLEDLMSLTNAPKQYPSDEDTKK